MASGFFELDGTLLVTLASLAGEVDMWWELDGSCIVPRATAAEPNFPAMDTVAQNSGSFGYSFEYSGSFVVPAEVDVQVSVGYGAGGTQYMGSLTSGGFAPTSPVLSVSNLGNGTARAYLSGADTATTNAIHAQPFNGSTWTQYSTIYGVAGTSSFGITPGGYWFRPQSDNGDMVSTGNIVFQTITNSALVSPMEEIMQVVRDAVTAAGIADSSGTAITAEIKWPPDWDTWSTGQAMVVADNEEVQPGMTGIDVKLHGINIILCEYSNGTDSLTPQLKARNNLAALFVGKRLSALPEVFCRGLSDSRVFDAAALQNYQGIYPITLQFETRVARTS